MYYKSYYSDYTCISTPLREGTPHFGLIYVYRSERTEQEDENGEHVAQHRWLPISTTDAVGNKHNTFFSQL